MKVLHLCLGNYYADNFGYQENIISRYHKEEGFDVTIIASRINYNLRNRSQFLSKTGEYTNEYGIKVKRLEYRYIINKQALKFSKILRLYKNLYNSLEVEKPEIIFIHGMQFWDIKQVVKYKKINRNVIIYADNHADYINSAKTFLSRNVLHKIIWKYRIKEFLPYCSMIWGVTPNRCAFLKEVYKIPKEKIGLLPMGAESEKIDFKNQVRIRREIREKFSLNNDDFVLISGGKIDKRKNIHHLIEAVKQLDNPKIRLLLFGAPNIEMEKIIKGISNSNYIKKIGWIEPDSIYDYFLASDLAIFPGTHSVLWEQAVGTGIPCVFKKWEGMTHIDVGGNCTFIEEGDIESIKRVINTIFHNKTEYCKMKKNAIDKGIPYFSYKEIAKKAIGFKIMWGENK